MPRATVLTLVALLAIACGQISGPSALDITERTAEYKALAEDFNDQWLLERRIWVTWATAQVDRDFRIPETCKETLTQAQERHKVLNDAMLLAGLDGNRREAYNLLGKQTALLRELDRDLKQGCR